MQRHNRAWSSVESLPPLGPIGLDEPIYRVAKDPETSSTDLRRLQLTFIDPSIDRPRTHFENLRRFFDAQE
jgi:hypothetical protein